MIEYIVFFSLIAAGLLAFFFRDKSQPIMDPVAVERIKCESPIERRLFDALQFRGYSITTQVKCGPYRIDLALLGPRIAIECDGKDYHSTPQQKARDRRKDRYLKENGWTVLRFSGKQITHKMPQVLLKINEICKKN